MIICSKQNVTVAEPRIITIHWPGNIPKWRKPTAFSQLAYSVTISHEPYRHEPRQISPYASRTTEELEFISRQAQEIYSPPKRTHRFSGPPNLQSNGYSRVRSPEVMKSGREADHSRPPSVETKNAWSHTYTPQVASWHDAYLSTKQLH